MLGDIHKVIKNHPNIVELIPRGLPPTWDHDYSIHLQPRSVSEINEEAKIIIDLETNLDTMIK